jgi:hypothetical protein
VDTLAEFGSSTYTYTYSEYGSRTISLAAGGTIAGSCNDLGTTSQSYGCETRKLLGGEPGVRRGLRFK